MVKVFERPPGYVRGPRKARFAFEYSPEERERWEADALAFGFPRFGHAYVHWLLNRRAAGQLMFVDPATESLARIAGKFLGEVAGEIISRAERAYLDGVK